MKTAVINFKTEPAIKDALTELARKFGVSLSFALEQSVRRTLAEGTLTVQELIPNAETRAAIDEARRDRALGKTGPVFDNVDDFIDHLNKPEE